ncbi:hypothetical protein [Brevibacillus borstelensis]|uniref:hypothetical protein n=1 Tax=Brevibacillus borstelensis TaxID=45462 RepID=UPI0030C422EC
MRESDLYDPIKQWMEERGFAVFPEVECRQAGGRADIVVTSGPIVGVVEMKQSLTLDLIDQALRWRGFANYIWIAIPYRKNGYKQFVNMVLRDYGIGVLFVSKHGTVWAEWNARFMRRAVPHLQKSLTEHHLTSGIKGGHSGGGYITPYRITINKVKHFLRRTGGWHSIREILDHCETHYASPRASLAKALQEYEAQWCEKKKEGGKLHFRFRLEGTDHQEGTDRSGNRLSSTSADVTLSEKQLSVLLVLSEEWQTPTRIARKLPGLHPHIAETKGSLYVNQPLKTLIAKGLAEKHPERKGQYRLTSAGEAMQRNMMLG